MSDTPDHLHLDPLILSLAREKQAEEGIEETPAQHEAFLRECVADIQTRLAEIGICLTLDDTLKTAALFDEVFGDGTYSGSEQERN